jgi:hypothetical protein
MMSSNHTPGPWLAHAIDDLGKSRVVWVSAIGDVQQRNVCTVVDHGSFYGPNPGPLDWRSVGSRQLKADAALIAAAPSLLFAARRALALLEDVTRGLPGEYEEVALLRAAIAKAEP